VIVERDAPDIGLVRRERLKRSQVGRALADHHVTRVDERLGEQVEPLLGARRDDDVVGRDPHAVLGHELDDGLAQFDPALARTVLQCLCPRVHHRAVRRISHSVRRHLTHLRHAAR